MRAFIHVSTSIVLCLLATACDTGRKESGVLPTRVEGGNVDGGQGVVPIVPGEAIRVTSGASDHSPVVNAMVTVGGQPYSTDRDGEFGPGPDDRINVGDPIDIQAAGFLPRSTRVPSDRIITLWPLANDTEKDALHRMVYQRGGEEIFNPPGTYPFTLTLVGASPEQTDAWRTEAAAFGAQFHIVYQPATEFQYEVNELQIRFSGGSCLPTVALGFCQEDNAYYRLFVVNPAKALDPRTIDRVLASWFLGPNPLPGFLNPSAPADSLSAFERQTIGMMFVRQNPTRWPDDDR